VNWMLTMSIAGLFVGLLLLLGLWEFVARRKHNRRWLDELSEAKRIGTDEPLSQHPHIDPHRCIGCACCVRACPEGVLALVEGTSRLIHASQCVGHAYCEQVCPVGAIVVGLGDIRSRPDVPILDENLESSLPGVFIAGELGGMALVRHGINQGTQAIDEIARRIRSTAGGLAPKAPLDVLIVGCGPAGIAATLRARQLGLSHVTIDREGLGGAVRKYPHNKMTMTQPVDLPLHGRLRRKKYRKQELLELWEGLFDRLGITVRREEWLNVKALPDGALESTTSQEKIVSRYVVLALGRRSTPRRLGVPGEEYPHVFYHLDDPAAYTNQALLVIGGGDSAAEAAIALAQGSGNRVAMSYRRPEFFRMRRRNLRSLERLRQEGRLDVILDSEIRRIERDHVILTVRRNGTEIEKQLPASAVFILIGGDPPFEMLRRLGIRFGGSAAAHASSIP
jgi:thioredoxin reductase (NADPH)